MTKRTRKEPQSTLNAKVARVSAEDVGSVEKGDDVIEKIPSGSGSGRTGHKRKKDASNDLHDEHQPCFSWNSETDAVKKITNQAPGMEQEKQQASVVAPVKDGTGIFSINHDDHRETKRKRRRQLSPADSFNGDSENSNADAIGSSVMTNKRDSEVAQAEKEVQEMKFKILPDNATPDCSETEETVEQEEDEEVYRKITRGKRMVAHLKTFENVKLPLESYQKLPDSVKEWMDLSKFQLQSIRVKEDTISNVVLFLANSFLQKSALLKYNDTNTGEYGCLRIRITEKMLALLVCVLTKYKFDNFKYDDLLQCEKIFRNLKHPGVEIWKIAKEEMQWMQKEGDGYFQKTSTTYNGSKSEVLFDEMFERHPDLELDAKLLLICIMDNNITN